MMDPQQIKNWIEAGLPGATIEVDGDGHHFQALIVSSAFEGKSLIERQRMVKALLREQFDSGALHALSMRTLTPEQWASERS
ncbi:MAG TPA: BolA family protein [Gammaproteobacteria bacterium]|nr:BolA family protein [Gammaproteobacteria bacterium]